MLNLERGRRSYYQRIDKEATILKYDLKGEKFFMVSEEKVSMHDSMDAKLVLEIENQKRILCIAAAKNGLLFTGGEDRNVTAWDTNSGQAAFSLEGAHATRVKGVVFLSGKAGGNEDVDKPYLVASASSDGVIRVWDVRMANKENPTPLAEVNTKSRLTCLAGSPVKSVKVKRRKNADKELDKDRRPQRKKKKSARKELDEEE
ncbi:hypothetical protein AQUCO_01600207v1 [Aquilegia coerulea]|uniref:Uncharacterized protein n=1 Tax=Aquilegia coerulea TaxID=218851 RepID=A0A2G5DRE1_AQUCA|nr:hypothetical protein AQUCO_01600207v1 [Aquilegia coerulea]PIA45807.1 hypothetical protein AQUCO_01600207v1 [Aquilegia coerulea]